MNFFDKHSVIYIAGPMRGYPYYNFGAFDLAKQQIESYGHAVLSPADMDRENGYDPFKDLNENFPTREECAKRDVEAIIRSDALVLLPGWRNSYGARMELAVAIFLDLEIFFYDPDFPGRFLKVNVTHAFETDIVQICTAKKL